MVTLAPTGVRLDQRKPTTNYGETPWLQLRNAERVGLLRAGLPADITPGSVVTSATLRIATRQAHSGARTLRVHLNQASWSVGKATWNNVPAIDGGSVVSVTKSSPVVREWWEFDVTAHVQQWVNGAARNFGWRLSTTQTSPAAFHAYNSGNGAAAFRPQLLVEWVSPSDAPSSLNPDGQNVSVSHPTLTYLTAPATSAQQVQINTSSDFSSPAFDSGQLATSVGELDLSTTAYAGISEAATAYWRARTLGGMGWSDWSSVAQFSRTAKGEVAIVSPGATTDDSTPPVLWEFDGTQQAWQVVVRDFNGKTVADSGRVTGDDDGWTPPKVVAREGQSASIEVRVWDDVDRAATPGDPLWVSTSITTTLSADGSLAGADSADAVVDGISPGVALSAERSNAPDGWAVVRDGVRIHRVDEPSTSFEWTDWTAAPWEEHTYRVAPIVNGQVSALGPLLVVTPEIQGLWLIDPETGTRAVLWDTDEGSWSAEEIAVTHQPIAGPPIRRVAYRPPMSGDISGAVIDGAKGYSASSVEAALWEFKGTADRELRFVAGYLNIPVKVGNISLRPTPYTRETRWGVASFEWWQTGENPWESE